MDMVFSSLLFLFRFLPVVLILYFAAPRCLKNAVLFFASLFFYAWGEPVYVVLMLFSTLVDYSHGLLVERFRKQEAEADRVLKGSPEDEAARAKKKKYHRCAIAVVCSSVVINLGLLGFFKYAGFLVETINDVFGTGFVMKKLALPIGISFYTFQTMSYTLDIYRGDATAQKNIINFGAYVALFPQLIAGPIVRYQTIAEELRTRKETWEDFSYGIRRFVTGVGKKVLLANTIGLLWDDISARAPEQIPVVMAWLGITAYAFQIYFDFSGYSDMAIGLGAMFGFHFPENFRYPYVSKSISEFWRRWHISLGTWFREYLYIPLGGNRVRVPRQVLNLAVVWLATGFWHGASWNFVVWGIYFGFFIIMEKLFLGKLLKRLPAFVSWLYTILLVWLGWVLFAFEDFGRGIGYLKSMFGAAGNLLCNNEAVYLLLGFAVPLLIMIIGSTELPARLAGRFVLEKKWYQTALSIFVVVIMVLSVAYLVDASYNPFLYFRF